MAWEGSVSMTGAKIGTRGWGPMYALGRCLCRPVLLIAYHAHAIMFNKVTAYL